MKRHHHQTCEVRAVPLSRNVRVVRSDDELRMALERAASFDKRVADVLRAREERYHTLLESLRMSEGSESTVKTTAIPLFTPHRHKHTQAVRIDRGCGIHSPADGHFSNQLR
jgi:hypothetical protein